MEKLTPITEAERIQVIDVIRGFSLFGILLVNMLDFSSPWLYIDPAKLWSSTVDINTSIFIDIFAQASFYALFSFLFGFGMIIFKERAIEKGYRFLPLYSRRLLVLLGIGIIHAFLIWHGDILISYALIGFILLLFHKAKPKTLLIWALALIIIPTLFLAINILVVESLSPGVLNTDKSHLIAKSIEVYSSGSFYEITQQRISDWLYVNNIENYIFLIFAILPMFLLGAFVAKKRWFHQPAEYIKQIKKLWLISLITAIIFKPLPYIGGDLVAFKYLQDAIGGPALALFYATSLVLLFQRTWWKNKLAYLSYVGRLSLSNYLMQSLIGTFIFYSYGLGFYGTVSPFYCLLLAIGIYVSQIFLSKIWLNKFRIGPAEWLWRSLTYMKKQQIKK